MSNISGKTVYFAEVSEEMRKYKDNLMKELEHIGCVIKEASDPRQDIEKIRETIEQCDIAIHMLSETDQIIESVGKGIEEQQIIFSVQHFLSQKLLSQSMKNGFRIFAWYPKLNSENLFEEERIPTHLQRIEQLDEVELVRTNFEVFKYYLLNKLKNDTEETVDEFYIKGNNNLSIYFLYDSVDKKIAKQYIDYLRKRGFTVFTPIFESDIMAVRQLHNSSLLKFDIAIIFAKEASVNWMNMKIMDVLKSPGIGREKGILGKAVFTSGQNVKATSLIWRGFDFIELDKNFQEDPLEGFLKKIPLK